MDLTKFDPGARAAKGADLHLLDPSTKEPIICEDGSPFVIRVLGRDAPTVKSVMRDVSEKLASGKLTEEEAGKLIVQAIVIGWSDEMALDGESLLYSPENTMRLIEHEQAAWILEQITPFAQSRRNFAKSTKSA